MDNNKQNSVDNKPTQHLTPEQKQREKDRIEREKKEEAELKKKLEEKLKKKKEKEKRIAVKKKKEVKRVKSLINLPFKLHIQISLLVTLLSFIVMFFGIELEPLETIYLSFMIFTIFYLGTGIIMVGVFFLISEEKIAEMEELKRIEDLNRVENKSKQDLEIEEMALIEKEIAARKLATKLLKEENIDNIKSMNFDDELDFMNVDSQIQKPKLDFGLEEEMFDEGNNSGIEIGTQNEARSLGSSNSYDIFDNDEFLDMDLKKQSA